MDRGTMKLSPRILPSPPCERLKRRAAVSESHNRTSEQETDVAELTKRLLEAFSTLRAAMAKDGVTVEMHLNIKESEKKP